jgi:thioredoxin-related protein
VTKIPLLRDLAQEMRQMEKEGIPLIILFSRSDCHFCHEVSNNYLLPIVRTVPEKKLIVRELRTDRTSSLIGVDGNRIATSALMKTLRVSFFPTVVFLGSGMRVLAEALVGLNGAGFYSAYLDQRIASAIENARSKTYDAKDSL